MSTRQHEGLGRKGFLIASISAGLLALGSMAPGASAAPGSIDPSFGISKGHSLVGSAPAVDPSTRFGAISALPNGATISAQWAGGRSILVKRLPDGRLDPGYGRSGSVMPPLLKRRDTGIVDIAIRGRWTIVLSSIELDKDTWLLVQRRNNGNGALDRSFGKKGTAKVRVSTWIPKYAGDGFTPVGPTLDARGRIYLGGSISWSNGPGLIVRLGPNGSLDRDYADHGAVVSNSGKCRSVDDLEATSIGVYAAVQDCLRRYDRHGQIDPDFDYVPTAGSLAYRPIVAATSTSVYLSVSENGDTLSGLQKVNRGGSVVSGFGNNGTAEATFAGANFTVAALGPDGGVYFAGDSDSVANSEVKGIAKLGADGLPDPGFDGDGLMLYDPQPGWATGYPDIAVLPDGLVLTGYKPGQSGSTTQLAKVLNDGVFDLGFGEDGFQNAASVLPPVDEIHDSLRMPGGGTVAAGRSDNRASLVRFRTNGKIDQSWGTNGWLQFRATDSEYDDVIRRLGLTDDGMVLACLDTDDGLKVARILRDGTLDGGFGTGGIASVPKVGRCAGIAPAPGRRVLVGATMKRSDPAVIRLDYDGSLDTSYGDDGYAIGDLKLRRGRGHMAFLGLPDGSAVVATPEVATEFKPDGKRDGSFGTDGVALIPRSPTGHHMDEPMAIDQTPDGGLLIGGHDDHSYYLLFLARLSSDGTAARRFGTSGARTIRTPVRKVEMTDLKAQANGRAVISYSLDSRCRFRVCFESVRVTRLLSSGKTDRSFGKKGTVFTRFGANSRATSLTVNQRGILVAGFAETDAGRSQALLMRLKK